MTERPQSSQSVLQEVFNDDDEPVLAKAINYRSLSLAVCCDILPNMRFPVILEGKQVAVVRNVDFAPRFMHSPALFLPPFLLQPPRWLTIYVTR